MWCHIKHATSSSVIYFVGHSLLNCACALQIAIKMIDSIVAQQWKTKIGYLDTDKVSSLVNTHVCGKRDHAAMAESPSKHIAGTPPIAMRVRHFYNYYKIIQLTIRIIIGYSIPDRLQYSVTGLVASILIHNWGITSLRCQK